MTPARVHVKNKAQAERLQRNLAGQGRTARLVKDPTSDITLAHARSACVTALQVAAGLALDLAGVKGKERRVLISPEFNRHCLKVARTLAQKMRTK